MDIGHHRLYSQQIRTHHFDHPSQVAASLGAIQAQDFPGAKWSIGLRLPRATESDIDQAIAEKTIIRTWLMRGTLHIVAAADIHWMLKLLASRIISGNAGRMRSLELDSAVFGQSEAIFTKALHGGNQLARDKMLDLLERENISTTGQRGYHILWQLALQGLICFAEHQGKQPYFALLDEWCSPSLNDAPEEPLAELANRYFSSHGPTTLEDFATWSGLKISDAKTGLNKSAASLTQKEQEGKCYWMSQDVPTMPEHSPTAYLLPGFDEYMLGYKDRTPTLASEHTQKICPGSNGMFIPTVVIDGQVRGTWKRTVKKETVQIHTTPFTHFNEAEQQAIAAAATHYSNYSGKQL